VKQTGKTHTFVKRCSVDQKRNTVTQSPDTVKPSFFAFVPSLAVLILWTLSAYVFYSISLFLLNKNGE